MGEPAIWPQCHHLLLGIFWTISSCFVHSRVELLVILSDQWISRIRRRQLFSKSCIRFSTVFSLSVLRFRKLTQKTLLFGCRSLSLKQYAVFPDFAWFGKSTACISSTDACSNFTLQVCIKISDASKILNFCRLLYLIKTDIKYPPRAVFPFFRMTSVFRQSYDFRSIDNHTRRACF